MFSYQWKQTQFCLNHWSLQSGFQESAENTQFLQKQRKHFCAFNFLTSPFSTLFAINHCFKSFFTRNLFQLRSLLWLVTLLVYVKFFCYAHVADVELPLSLHSSQKAYRSNFFRALISFMTPSGPPMNVSFLIFLRCEKESRPRL